MLLDVKQWRATASDVKTLNLLSHVLTLSNQTSRYNLIESMSSMAELVSSVHSNIYIYIYIYIFFFFFCESK